MDKLALTEYIKNTAYSAGFDIVGIAPPDFFAETETRLLSHIAEGNITGLAWFTPDRASFSCDPANLMPEVRSIISLGISYLTNNIPVNAEAGNPKGKIAKYAWGQDYHQVLKEKMIALFESIRQYLGQDASEARFLVDTARIVDRAVAQRAGIGFFGKNANIINKKFGSWIFLCEILTDLDLEYDAPGSGTCGKCTRCIDACPTDAIISPGVVKNDSCISFLTIELKGTIPQDLREPMGNWIFGCDICQDVCPYNKKAIWGNHPEFEESEPGDSNPDLLEMLKLTENEEAFRKKYKGTPLLRPKRNGLRRNIAVALGNSGDKSVLEPLYRTLDGEQNEVVREHLSWAIHQIEDKA